MKDNKIRLQKHLSSCGIASRRKAEELIEQGKVRVNGRIATLGDKVDPKRDKVTVRGKNVIPMTKKVYIMLHKPRGYVTTLSDEFDRKNVADLVKDVGVKVFPVGRLDRDSEGLLIMTNDGELANIITHPSSHVNKTYRVTVGGAVDDDQIKKLCEGVLIDGKKTLPCDVFVIERREDRTVLNFIIQEGRNRQIRKMFEFLGYNVVSLKRIRHANIELTGLKKGQIRQIKPRQIKELKAYLEKIKEEK